MSSLLDPRIDDRLQEISALGLAHVGDAVYELMVRTWLCVHGTSTAKNLHSGSVALVSAKAQAVAAEHLKPHFSDEELAVFKRGRNAQVNSNPRGSTLEEYHAATALEAVFGYLYLSGRMERLNELFEMIVDSAKG